MRVKNQDFTVLLVFILTCFTFAPRFSANAKRRKHDSEKKPDWCWEKAAKADLDHFILGF